MLTLDQLRTKTPAELGKIQNQRLRYFLKHLLPFHPFYSNLFKKESITINSVAELEKLPFTTKLDILPTEQSPAQPREFILQPNEALIKEHYPKAGLIKLLVKGKLNQGLKAELEKEFKPIHTHFTTGRSSAQIPFLYTTRDLDVLREIGKRLVEVTGSQDTVVVSAFPFAPHLAFWLAYFTTEQARLQSIHTGGGKVLGTQKILNSLERTKASMLLVMPGYGYHLLREAIEQKRDLSNLRFVVLGGERVSAGFREKMKEMLAEVGAKKVKVLSTYAFTESKTAWVQCHEDSGYHLYPDLEYIELVDADGKPVPEGEPGEIVYTALDWRGSMVLRYRTGDMSQGLYWSKPCEYCGSTVPRLHRDVQRKFDNVDINLTKVKGELINLGTIAELVHSAKDVAEWQIEIRKKDNDPYGLDEMIIHVALRSKTKEAKLVTELTNAIRENAFVSPLVEVHELAELVQLLGLETELKEKRVIDRRKEQVKHG